jgi:hypothetical protein
MPERNDDHLGIDYIPKGSKPTVKLYWIAEQQKTSFTHEWLKGMKYLADLSKENKDSLMWTGPLTNEEK